MIKLAKFLEELNEFFEENYESIYVWIRLIWGLSVSLLFIIGVLVNPAVLSTSTLGEFGAAGGLWFLWGIRIFLIGFVILSITSLFTIKKWISESFFDDILLTILEMAVCVLVIIVTVVIGVSMAELFIWAFS